MKQINHKLRNTFLSLVMILIILGATYTVLTSDRWLEGLNMASAKQVKQDIDFQLSMIALICSTVGLMLLNTKMK
jgi:hypothetical protein